MSVSRRRSRGIHYGGVREWVSMRIRETLAIDLFSRVQDQIARYKVNDTTRHDRTLSMIPM